MTEEEANDKVCLYVSVEKIGNGYIISNTFEEDAIYVRTWLEVCNHVNSVMLRNTPAFERKELKKVVPMFREGPATQTDIEEFT